MDFDDSKKKTSSSRTLLYQQVQEQSDICDVTIQIKQWESRFHWCVLVASPFFDTIHRNYFIEKQTSTVKLNIATPLGAETAILFLYGKKPHLTEENVGSILEMSEFLLIPNLKSACVAFLKTLLITEENCMKLLDMSSLYDFELSKCDDFIKGHLRDILQKEEATYLSKESVIALLRDPHLSYFTPEEKFTFAAKWANRFERNIVLFPEVFECISLKTVSAEFLETVILQHPLVLAMRYTHTLLTLDSLKEHKVLIVQGLRDERIACFDLDNETWHGIDVGLPNDMENSRFFRNHAVDGVIEPSGIYRVANGYNNCKIAVQDLPSKSAYVATISAPVISGHTGGFSSFCADGTTLVAVSVVRVETNRCREQPVVNFDALLRLALFQRSGLSSPFIENQIHHVYKESSTIFCGQLQYPDTTVSPILTLRDAKVTLCCMNAENKIALLTENRKNMFIYDTANCQLDIIPLENQFYEENIYSTGQINIAPNDDGFVLHNNKVALRIARLNGPLLTERYVVQKVNLEHYVEWHTVKYLFSHKTWFRFLKRGSNSEIEFSIATHDDLMNITAQDLNWKKLQYDTDRFGDIDNTFMIKLPRSMLTCHFNCPHCEQQLQQHVMPSTKSPASIEDYLYDDSEDGSDKARYGCGYEDYYDDYDMYYDSD